MDRTTFLSLASAIIRLSSKGFDKRDADSIAMDHWFAGGYLNATGYLRNFADYLVAGGDAEASNYPGRVLSVQSHAAKR